jgi:hypothetical protein
MKIYKMFHPTIVHGVIVQETNTFHGVQSGSLVKDLPIFEDPLLEEQHNLLKIKDFSTSQDIKHHDLQ